MDLRERIAELRQAGENDTADRLSDELLIDENYRHALKTKQEEISRDTETIRQILAAAGVGEGEARHVGRLLDRIRRNAVTEGHCRSWLLRREME